MTLNYFHVVISNGLQAGEILKISHIRSLTYQLKYE